MKTEMLPIEFAAMKDPVSGELQRANVEDGMKRLEIIAEWGGKTQRNLNLVAYKANL